MRATTLKASGETLDRLLDYYAGLAEDQQRRDGAGRGPVDYYLDPGEPPGRWWGEGCAAVGVAGEVAPEELRALLVGRHPGTDRVLGRRFGDKSARAYDATFSAAKSVSLLWALSSDPWVRAEVLAAHDTAVEVALSWLERHGGVTRRGTDGVDQVDTGGLTVALFRQHTSRTADLQLHTHAIVCSKVRDPTGKWLSLDARFLKRQQRSIGWLYDAALRTELTARLDLEWEPVVDGRSDLVAVPAELRDLFSQRSAQVELQLAEVLRCWVDDHDGAEPDPRTVARLEPAVLDSRPAKQTAGDADALRAEWCQRAEQAGLSPKVEDGGRQVPLTPRWTREAVIEEALARVSEQGSTWLTADVARELSTLVPPTPPPLPRRWSTWSTTWPPRRPVVALSCTHRHRPAPGAGPTDVPSPKRSSTACSAPPPCWPRRPACPTGRPPQRTAADTSRCPTTPGPSMMSRLTQLRRWPGPLRWRSWSARQEQARPTPWPPR